MNKLLLFVVLVVAGKFGFDAFQSRRIDREMLRSVEEFNRKLPISTEYVRLDRMAYSERMVRVSGTLLTTKALTEEGKAASRKMLTQDYCGYRAVLDAKVGVTYTFSKVTLPSLNDKLREETWAVTLRPEDCR